MHDFDVQLSRGEGGEDLLDTFFKARGHLIEPATRGQQARGIDRVFVKDGKIAFIEYKTDFRAHETGHVFIETISVDTREKAGWAYTSEADYLVYYVPVLKAIYVMPLSVLRTLLPGWLEAYPSRPAQNKTYSTHGLLVPLEEFSRHSSRLSVTDGEEL